MDATLLPHILAKLDMIREHQIREGEALNEVRHLLRNQPQSQPSTVTGIVSSRLEKWLFSLRPLAAGAGMMVRHAIAVATIVYMAKSGQEDKIWPYVNWLLGM